MRIMAAAILASLIAFAGGGFAQSVDQPPPLSATQLHKLLAYVRGPLGTGARLYAPYGYLLGWTADPTLDMDEIEVGTDDNRHSFVQSRASRADLAVSTLTRNGVYWFSTHDDLRLDRAVYGARGEVPHAVDPAAPEILGLYRDALADWARDLDHSPPAQSFGRP
jgi:hypothetical protein